MDLGLTKLVLRTRLELLIGHELFDTAGESRHMVDDEFVEIRELILPIDNEWAAGALPRGIGVGLVDVCD